MKGVKVITIIISHIYTFKCQAENSLGFALGMKKPGTEKIVHMGN